MCAFFQHQMAESYHATQDQNFLEAICLDRIFWVSIAFEEISHYGLVLKSRVKYTMGRL